MYMSVREICREYRWSKNQDEQIRILSDLNIADPVEIILLLWENGEQLTRNAYRQLYQRLDTLNSEIMDREKAYRRAAVAVNGR